MTRRNTRHKDVGHFVPVRERKARVGMQGGLRMRKVLLMSMALALVGLAAASSLPKNPMRLGKRGWKRRASDDR